MAFAGTTFSTRSDASGTTACGMPIRSDTRTMAATALMAAAAASIYLHGRANACLERIRVRTHGMIRASMT